MLKVLEDLKFQITMTFALMDVLNSTQVRLLKLCHTFYGGTSYSPQPLQLLE